MNNESLTIDLFAALNILVLERLEEDLFKVVGRLPDWFFEFCTDETLDAEIVKPGKKFLFVENFLIDAENFWRKTESGSIKSGPWTESDSSDNEHHLEASAISLGARKVLLIEFSKLDFEEKQYIIQKGRENSLRYERMIKEMQKKEILLHCIVHDLRQPLSAIRASFDLVRHFLFGQLSERDRGIVELGLKAIAQQDILIQEILSAFSADVLSINAYEVDSEQSPDLAVCAKEAMDALLPAFILEKVRLCFAPGIDLKEEWRVVGERSRLERVFSNLLGNALRHSKPRDAVTVEFKKEGDFVFASVDDQGKGVPPEWVGNLFQKFFQGGKNTGAAGLGLYFCRITIERWGGEIGYEPLPEGGSRFWFRLPIPK